MGIYNLEELRKELDKIRATREIMANDEIHLVEGCRRLVGPIRNFQHLFSEKEWRELFYTILSFEGDTERFPIGNYRAKCTKERLEEADKQVEFYMQADGKQVREACDRICELIFTRVET